MLARWEKFLDGKLMLGAGIKPVDSCQMLCQANHRAALPALGFQVFKWWSADFQAGQQARRLRERHQRDERRQENRGLWFFVFFWLSASIVFNAHSLSQLPKPELRISVPRYLKLPCKLVRKFLQQLQWQIVKFMVTVKVFTNRGCLKSLLSNRRCTTRGDLYSWISHFEQLATNSWWTASVNCQTLP